MTRKEHLHSKRRVPGSSPGRVKIQERWYSQHMRKKMKLAKSCEMTKYIERTYGKGISPGEGLNDLTSHQHGNDLPSHQHDKVYFFFQNVLSYSLRDPDWDIVHRKTSHLTSRIFFYLKTFRQVCSWLRQFMTRSTKKPRPFYRRSKSHKSWHHARDSHEILSQSQITFPVPTLNSTRSHSTFGYALRRCSGS